MVTGKRLAPSRLGALLIGLVAMWLVAMPAAAAITSCPAVSRHARVYPLPFGFTGALVALEDTHLNALSATKLMLYLPVKGSLCRAILVDKYGEEGAAPEVMTLFYQRINDQHNVVVLVRWEQHHRGIDLYGDYYKVYAYRLTPRGRLVPNMPVSNNPQLSGLDGSRGQTRLTFPYTNASRIRAYFENAHSHAPASPAHRPHLTVQCSSLSTQKQLYTSPIYASLNATIGITTSPHGRQQLIQYRPYGNDHCMTTRVALLPPQHRIITLFFQSLDDVTNLFVITTHEVNHATIHGTHYRVIGYEPDGNHGLVENPAVSWNPLMSGLGGSRGGKKQHFRFSTAASVKHYYKHLEQADREVLEAAHKAGG